MSNSLTGDCPRPPARLALAVLVWTLVASAILVWAVHHEARAQAEAWAQAAGERDVDRLARAATDALQLAMSKQDADLATAVADELIRREPDLAGLRVELDNGATTLVGKTDPALLHRQQEVDDPNARAPRRLGTVTAFVRPPAAAPVDPTTISPPLGLALGGVLLGFLALALWIRHRVRMLAVVASDIAGGKLDDARPIRGNDEVAWASAALGELREVLAGHVDRVHGRNAALLRDVTLKEDRLDRLEAFAAVLVAPLAESSQLDHALAALHDDIDAAFSLLFVPRADDRAGLRCRAAVGIAAGEQDPRLCPGWFASGIDLQRSAELEDLGPLDEEHPWMAAARRRVPCEGVVAVRLRFQGRLEGVVVVARHTPLSEADRHFLADIARPFAIALANRRAYETVVAMKKALETTNDALLVQRDELEIVDRMRRQFVANMSHELRTPLNAIVGFTELLADGCYGSVSEDQAGALQSVLDASNNLLTLVNQVLDLSRAEAGGLEPNVQECELRELARDVVRLTSPAYRDRPYTPEVVGPPQRVHTDPEWTRQILTNLVGNAIKFTQAGSVTVNVVPQVDGGVQLVVEDTGAGIDPAHMELIFEEFQQGDGSSTRAHDGVGLGLAISRRLARAMGATLTVKSEPGRGSRFTLGLPARPATSTTTTAHRRAS
jgi:signal transduction histidine kinase